jgi:hypothetical protein
MTKREKKECDFLVSMGKAGLAQPDYLARGFSSLVRSAGTERTRNEIITAAAGFPAVVRHAEFIV